MSNSTPSTHDLFSTENYLEIEWCQGSNGVAELFDYEQECTCNGANHDSCPACTAAAKLVYGPEFELERVS